MAFFGAKFGVNCKKMAFFGVNFILQKFGLCKKNDKYELWPIHQLSTLAFKCHCVHSVYKAVKAV